MSNITDYNLKGSSTSSEIPVPELPYAPPRPDNYQPRIGLIGCGGITKHHLEAYQTQNYEVVALCDLREEAASEKRKLYFPHAEVFTDYHQLLARDDIDVVDIALHPAPRAAAIEKALSAGKHVLSQKPFVLDLDEGQRLVAFANTKGLKLAVNQNGRWAPYVHAIAEAIRRGYVGDIQDVNISLNWDHIWIKGTAFETIHHVILYDFAIHWIDMVRLFYGDRKAHLVFASVAGVPGQDITSPMLAKIIIQFEQGLASLSFDAHCKLDKSEQIVVTGNRGVIRATGINPCAADYLTLTTPEGTCRPEVEGNWFQNGFQGTMGELLCAIERNRVPENNAADNLKSLELAFAAIESADSGLTVVPGQVRRVGENCISKT